MAEQDVNGAGADVSRIRFRVALHRPLKTSISAIVLYVGIFFGMLFVAILLLNWISDMFTPSNWGTAGIFLFGLGFAALIIFPMRCANGFVNRIRMATLRTRHDRRCRRLTHMLARTDAFRRVPHRLVENALFHHVNAPAAVKKIRKSIGPGNVIFLIQPKDDYPIAPAVTDVTFEPIGIGDRDAISWLCFMNSSLQSPNDSSRSVSVMYGEANGAPKRLSADGQAIPWQEASDRMSRELKRSMRRKKLLIWTNVLTSLICFGSMFRSLWRGAHWTEAWYLYYFLGLMLFGGLLSIIFDRGMWIIPRGMVTRFAHVFKRGPTLKVWTPEDTSIFVSYRDNAVYLIREGKVKPLILDQTGVWAVLSAWVSRAERPSMEKLKGLLDPEGK